MTTAIDEKTQKVIDQTVEKYPRGWTYGVCAFGVFERKGGRHQGGGIKGDACHNDINYMQGGELVVNAHKQRWTKDFDPEFVKWIMRESPYSHGVLNRSDDKQILGQCAVIDSELVGVGGTLWLCKATRHLVEDLWKHKTWTKLRECGLTGLQAFIGADILREDGHPNPGGSHCSLFGYDMPDKLRKTYDDLMNLKGGKCKGKIAFTRGMAPKNYAKPWEGTWGGLKGKMVRMPDGWGGFTEVCRPCEVKDYAAQLKEIFEGDPKNVK
jgi:hypothetical protein